MGRAFFMSVVYTSSPTLPGSSTSPVTGSTVSTRIWSSTMCRPSFASHMAAQAP